MRILLCERCHGIASHLRRAPQSASIFLSLQTIEHRLLYVRTGKSSMSMENRARIKGSKNLGTFR